MVVSLLTLLLGLRQCCDIGGDHLAAAQLVVGPYSKLVGGVGRQPIDLHLTLPVPGPDGDYGTEMIVVRILCTLQIRFVPLQDVCDLIILTTLGAMLMGSMRLHSCS